MYAANGHAEMCAFLISKGSSVSTPDKLGRTPLMDACESGQTKIVKLLLEYGGTDPNQTDREYCAALSYCIDAISSKEPQYLECAWLLIENGSVPDWAGKKVKRTLLHCLVALQDMERIVQLCEQYKAEVVIYDEYSNKPIDFAIKVGNNEIAEYLLDRMTNNAADSSYTSFEFPDLPLPFKNKLKSKIYYLFQTFLVTNPRLHALFLLYRMTWPRALVLFDMYTDGAVAISLLNENEAVFFMISCVLFITPFLLVWVASLRFLQRWVNQRNDKKQHQIKLNKCLGKITSICIYLYMFPPIGCFVMFVLEILWVIKDVWNGFVAFWKGDLIIETQDAQYQALKVLFCTLLFLFLLVCQFLCFAIFFIILARNIRFFLVLPMYFCLCCVFVLVKYRHIVVL